MSWVLFKKKMYLCVLVFIMDIRGCRKLYKVGGGGGGDAGENQHIMSVVTSHNLATRRHGLTVCTCRA